METPIGLRAVKSTMTKTTQDRIYEQLNVWLDDGFDVHAVLNQVMTIRRGEAEVAARNKEWAVNSKYIFGVKTADECLDHNWTGFCISIVKKEFWKTNRHIEDVYLRDVHLPNEFGQTGRGNYDHSDENVSRRDVIRTLTGLGFQHSIDLQNWMKQHDP